MLESTRAGLTDTILPSKLVRDLVGRDVLALGAVDVVSVTKERGAIGVLLRSRGADHTLAAIEILPLPAGEFVRQVPQLIRGIHESRRSPVPAMADVDLADKPVVIGEVAMFQVAPTAGGDPEMLWCAVETIKALRCMVTTGQLEALAADIGAVLSSFAPEDHKARLVDCTKLGSARKLTEADGDLPIGAFIDFAPKPKLRAAPRLDRVLAEVAFQAASVDGARIVVDASFIARATQCARRCMGASPIGALHIHLGMTDRAIAGHALIHGAWIIVVAPIRIHAFGGTCRAGHARRITSSTGHPGRRGTRAARRTTLRGGASLTHPPTTLRGCAAVPAGTGAPRDRTGARCSGRTIAADPGSPRGGRSRLTSRGTGLTRGPGRGASHPGAPARTSGP